MFILTYNKILCGFAENEEAAIKWKNSGWGKDYFSVKV